MTGVADQAAAMGPANPGKPKAAAGAGAGHGGRFEIRIQPVVLGIGAAWMAYGLILFVYTARNNNVDRYDPSCSVVTGRIHGWMSNMSYTMLLYGFFGLVVSGCVPKMFQVMKLKDEAICCSDICQGMCGDVVRAFIFIFLCSLNLYGTYLLIKAYQTGVQYEYPQLSRTFCQKDFFEFAIVTNALIVTIIFTMLLLACRQCFLAMSYDKKLGHNKFGPKGENLEKELGLTAAQQKNRKKQLKAQRARKKAAKKRGRRGGPMGRGGKKKLPRLPKRRRK